MKHDDDIINLTSRVVLYSLKYIFVLKIIKKHDEFFFKKSSIKDNYGGISYNNSLSWYKAAINWYIEQYGDFPSKIGPGKDVTFIIED